MTLSNAANGSATRALAFTPPGKFMSGCNFVWDAMDLTEDQILDGEVLVLTFVISDTAASGTYPVQISYVAGDVFDLKFNDLVATLNNGSVTIS